MRLLIVAVILFSFGGLANADSQYGKFRYFSKLPNTAFFIGEIKNGDSFDFRKLMRNHEIDTLVISSTGGSVWEALSIAGIIHDNGTNLYIPESAECYSACSFIFFAGKSRLAKGKLGVHQFSSVESNTQKNVGVIEGGTQFTTSEIIGFLNEFDTPPWVYEKMFAQKEMYVFSPNELNKLERGVMAGFQASKVEQFISSSRLRSTEDITTSTQVETNPKWKYNTDTEWKSVTKPEWKYVEETVYLSVVSGEWVYDNTGYKNTWRILAENNTDYELRLPKFIFKPRACGSYSRNIVLQVQNELRNQGYDVGTPDGLAGYKTSNGIKAYQKNKGLKITGKIDNELLSSLNIDDESDWLEGPVALALTYPIPPNRSLFIEIPFFKSWVENIDFCYYLEAKHTMQVPAN